ncbi:MAG: hypothetical protein HYY06_10305 [Deltaproteobacteria bacterium]|nr:hypothetical protein [Deltaproteobacteria bacterium]
MAVNKKLAETAPAPAAPQVGTVFSAASFAGVVSKYASGTCPEPDATPSAPVIAFYGFRGGAGRTTALAHIAALLSARQVHVVAIDLDMEAPGLDRVLDCPEPEEDRGGLVLLRAAAMASDAERANVLRLAPHVVKSRLDLGAPIRVLPAGRLSERYLERLEDLGVPLWHVAEGPSPLQAVLQRVHEELQPQVVCLDCRTGLYGLSAAAVFHVADVVVCFVPVSGQVLEGLSVFLKGVKAARLQRAGRPELLIVPSMVPEGPEGRSRLENWFVPEVEARYAEIVLGSSSSDDAAEDLTDRVPIVREGIEYRRGIALSDVLHTDFVQRSAGAYQALVRQLDHVISLGAPAAPVAVDAKKMLAELRKKADLKNLAFAESTDPRVIVDKFIQPADFKAIVDRSAWYVVGAKGAGKTWMWQYLLSSAGQTSSPGVSFLAGHGPMDPVLSANAMREIARDKTARVEQRQLHGAFWLFYAANRVMRQEPRLAAAVDKRFRAPEKGLVKQLASATTPDLVQAAVTNSLAHDRAGTFAEQLIRALDAELLSGGSGPLTLLYDGLDVGFGSDEKSIAMRRRFVDGLVEAIEPLRGACKRIGFKLFLREDIFSEIEVQNQSHLSAATVELKWEPGDIWALALNLVLASPTYVKTVRAIDPSAGPGQLPREEERLQALLVPLWGDEMERGNKVSTARFVQRRTSDGKDRLFPRTLVQLLAAAVEHQATLEASSDRVLRAAAVLHGYNEASQARVDDLRKEYVTLAAYLDALKGRKPTGTETEILDHLKRQLRASSPKRKARKGAPAGALHAGTRGWHKVIDRLLDVGVLREYRRAKGSEGEKKYEIALLYRPGLGIKAFGV